MEQSGHVTLEVGFEVDPAVGEVDLMAAIETIKTLAEEKLHLESSGPFAIVRIKPKAAVLVTDNPEGPAVIG